MRTNVQLLKILFRNIYKIKVAKDEGDYYLPKGICYLIDMLEATNYISHEERHILKNIIRKNITYRYKHTTSLYYFKPGKRFLRRIYIITLIVKYSIIKTNFNY